MAPLSISRLPPVGGWDGLVGWLVGVAVNPHRTARLDWTMIEFQDNQPVIDLVSKKPRGLLIQLEEQGLLGRRANNKALLQVSRAVFVIVSLCGASFETVFYYFQRDMLSVVTGCPPIKRVATTKTR